LAQSGCVVGSGRGCCSSNCRAASSARRSPLLQQPYAAVSRWGPSWGVPASAASPSRRSCCRRPSRYWRNRWRGSCSRRGCCRSVDNTKRLRLHITGRRVGWFDPAELSGKRYSIDCHSPWASVHASGISAPRGHRSKLLLDPAVRPRSGALAEIPANAGKTQTWRFIANLRLAPCAGPMDLIAIEPVRQCLVRAVSFSYGCHFMPPGLLLRQQKPDSGLNQEGMVNKITTAATGV